MEVDSFEKISSEADPKCIQKKKLVETVLNYPDVIRYSKTQIVRKKFNTIYISFYENDLKCSSPTFIQRGDTLIFRKTNDSINTVKMPVYEFKALDILDDSAYVYFEFDITGAVAYGSLKKINEQWVPGSIFVIGVR